MSQSLYIEQNVDGGISDFRISSQSFINKNCPNSRTSYDTDINHGTVTKLDKRNTAIQKKLTTTSCQQIVTYLSFFQFMVNLEQSRSQIFDAWSIKHTFRLSHKNRTTELRHSQQSPCIIALSRGTILPKNAEILQKIADISKTKRVLVLKDIFSKTTYLCVSTYRNSSFYRNLTSFTQKGEGG